VKYVLDKYLLRNYLAFVNALKEGKGLLIIKTFIDDNYDNLADNGDLEEIQELFNSK